MINGPFNTSPNYDSIDSDFQDNHQSEEYSENFIQRNLNDDEEVDINNHQSETGINMSNDLVPIINEAPHNENNSENKKDFISKKRKKTKKSNEKNENKNKKEKYSNRDNSIKEGIKALLLIIKIIIEIFGNITLSKFDCNEFVGGTSQNKILCKSKIYQIFSSNEDYKKILEETEPANPEDKKIFNYFLTRTFNYLFQKYYLNDRVFLIEGKKETITLFRTFSEEKKRRKEKVYELDNEEKKEEKIKNFIDASKLIFNNFEGCKTRERAELKHYDKIKIDKFENYLKQNNNIIDNKEKEKEKEEIHNLIKKESDEKSLKEDLDNSKSEDSKEPIKDVNEPQSKNDEIFSEINPEDNNNNNYGSNLLDEPISFNGFPSIIYKTTTNNDDNNMPSPINIQNYENNIFKKCWDNAFFNDNDLQW